MNPQSKPAPDTKTDLRTRRRFLAELAAGGGFVLGLSFGGPLRAAVLSAERTLPDDFAPNAFVRITPDGEAETWLEVPEGRNAHLVATEQGLYVTKIESNRIYHIDRGGTIAPFAGSGELGFEDGDQAGEGRIEDVEAAGVGAEGGQDQAPAVGDEAAPGEPLVPHLDRGLGMEVAGDLAGHLVLAGSRLVAQGQRP